MSEFDDQLDRLDANNDRLGRITSETGGYIPEGGGAPIRTWPDLTLEFDAAQGALYTARDEAKAARDASLQSRDQWPTTAAGIGNGIAAGPITADNAGAGGTAGTYPLAVTGGTAVIAAVGSFVVAGGKLTAIYVDPHNYYTVSPTAFNFAAAGFTTAPTVVVVTRPNTVVTDFFGVPGPTGVSIYRVDPGPVAFKVLELPSSTALGNAAAAGKAVMTVNADMPVGYPDYVEGFVNTQGEFIVINEITGAATKTFLKPDSSVMSEYALTSYLGAGAVNADLPNGYPTFVIGAVNAATGEYMVLYEEDTSGVTVAPGAGTGSSGTVFENPPREWLVILVVGQSNAAGKGTGGSYVTPPAGTALYWDPNGTPQLRALADPLSTNPGFGSAWPQLAKTIFETTGYGVVIVPAYEGGTAAQYEAAGDKQATGDYWEPSPSGAPNPNKLLNRAISRLSAACAALDAGGYTYRRAAIIDSQGESDAAAIDNFLTVGTPAGVSKQNYKDAKTAEFAYLRAPAANAEMPVVIIRTGTQKGIGNTRNDTTGFQQVRAAQEELCREIPNVHMGFVGAFNFPVLGGMEDGLHYAQGDLNAAADRTGRCVAVVSQGIN